MVGLEFDAREEELECFDDLEYYVIERGVCTGCGTCAGVCPRIGFENDRPVMKDEYDPHCNSCTRFCPQFYVPSSRMEEMIFGAVRNDRYLGYVDQIVSARSNSDVIRSVSQDGGVTTTLSKYLLESGAVEGVLMAGVSEREPLKPVPIVATTGEDVVGAAGSRYSICPVVMGLREAFDRGMKKIAIVGTPCQVQGIRKLELFSEDRYPFDIKAVIGIFCFENFRYDELFKNFIEGELGIELAGIKSVKIRNNSFELHKSGEVESIPLKSVFKHANEPCMLCRDFSAELSDISIGAIGAKTDWNTVIIRSERGRRLFEEVVEKDLVSLSSDKVDVEELRGMGRRKKRHVEKMSAETREFLTQFGVSEDAVRIYELLIALHGPRLETISEATEIDTNTIKEALDSLKERNWIREKMDKTTNTLMYIPERPEVVINNEMKKLNSRLKMAKKKAIADLNSSYLRRIQEIN